MKRNNFHMNLLREVAKEPPTCEKDVSEFKFIRGEDDERSGYVGWQHFLKDEKNFIYRKTILHRHRKNLISLIYFFVHTKHVWEKFDKLIIIYIGLGRTRHILYLFDLFEKAGLKTKFEWHIYDKEEFHEDVVKYASLNMKFVKLFDEYFTEDVAQFYGGQKTIFVSDYHDSRITKLIYHRSKTVEEIINWKDNRLSTDKRLVINELTINDANKVRKLYEELRPICANVFMRIPSMISTQISSFYFMDGEICFYPWNGFQSSESRLFVTDYKFREWDTLKHELQSFHHNYVTRFCAFNTQQPEYKDYCPCWSCTYECSAILAFHKTFSISYVKSAFYETTSAVIDKLMGRELYWEWTSESLYTKEG